MTAAAAPPVHADLVALLDVIDLEAPAAYLWFGRRFLASEANGDQGVHAMERLLHERLYEDFYCSGRPTPRMEMPVGALDRPGGQFREDLTRANRGTRCVQGGWTVVGRHDRGPIVEREGPRLFAEDDDVTTRGGDATVAVASEAAGASRGFYTALGDAELRAGRAEGIDRHYWSVRADGAAALVERLTGRMNAAGLAFRLKVADAPAAFWRRDAAVLYTRRIDRERTRSVCFAVHGEIAPSLRRSGPALTLRLAPGLSFAEDPGGGESFGSHRCRMIARALCRAHGANVPRGERLEALVEEFLGSGVDPGTPHLARRVAP